VHRKCSLAERARYPDVIRIRCPLSHVLCARAKPVERTLDLHLTPEHICTSPRSGRATSVPTNALLVIDGPTPGLSATRKLSANRVLGSWEATGESPF
jgi:hypothetical protein